MTRLLYVSGGGVASVRKDGASLLVQVEGEADRRYPFRLLARVVLQGDTRIHAAAIWGLMEAGVPVSLQSRTGAPCGVIVPYQPRKGRAQEDIECLVERGAAASHWKDWLGAMERRELRRALGRAKVEVRDLRPAAVEAYLRGLEGATTRRKAERRRGMMSAEVLHELAGAGFAPGYLASMERDLEIVSGLTRLLLWDWWIPTVLAAPEGRGDEDEKAAWEGARLRERRRAAFWVQRFTNWLREMEWRATSDMHGW